MTALCVTVCPSCGWRGFPQRIWCPRCGCRELEVEPAGRGTTTETAVVIRAVGRDLGQGVRLATVALELGGTVVVRAEEPALRHGVVVERDHAPTLEIEAPSG